MNAIETKQLTKYYGKSRGIIDLNLAVKEQDFFGFIGPNGAGKSTTIRTLLGLIGASSGEAKVLGLDSKTDKTKILSQVGYLPSEVAFYNGMRVRDVLKLSADLHKKDCSAQAKKLCERLELDPGKKVEELSFGNKKKVGIVCAMQHEPKLFIMDEPTSGLDPLMQREFFALLTEYNEAGATVFLSSHVLSEVQKYCKRAAVIREGRLLVCDSVEKLGHTGAKRVTLHGDGVLAEQIRIRMKAGDAKNGYFRDIVANEEGIRFLYSGEPGKLLQMISDLPMKDLTITEPDLEEVFLHYYEKEADEHDSL